MTNQQIEEAREGLRQFPPALSQEFESALAAVEPILEADELAQWLRDGLDIARHSLRSWEAASEYFRALGSGAGADHLRPDARVVRGRH